jgi:hypothetical protein
MPGSLKLSLLILREATLVRTVSIGFSARYDDPNHIILVSACCYSSRVQADAFNPAVNTSSWQVGGMSASWWGLHRIGNEVSTGTSAAPYSYTAAWELLRGPLLLLLMCFVQRWSQVSSRMVCGHSSESSTVQLAISHHMMMLSHMMHFVICTLCHNSASIHWADSDRESCINALLLLLSGPRATASR